MDLKAFISAIGKAPSPPIYATMLIAPVDSIDAVSKLALDPLKVTQSRAVCELVQHPGRNELGCCVYASVFTIE